MIKTYLLILINNFFLQILVSPTKSCDSPYECLIVDHVSLVPLILVHIHICTSGNATFWWII